MQLYRDIDKYYLLLKIIANIVKNLQYNLLTDNLCPPIQPKPDKKIDQIKSYASNPY